MLRQQSMIMSIHFILQSYKLIQNEADSSIAM